jgi:hypothetical protein
MGMMQDPEVMGKDGSLLSCCGVAG